MVSNRGQLGASTLRLLSGRSAVRVLRALTDHPAQPSELAARFPDLTRSLLMRRLGELTRAGAVKRIRVADVPPRAYYAVSDAGRDLPPVFDAAVRWERRWSSLARPDEPGTWVLGVLADEANRTILLALADGPLRPIEIDHHLSGLARSATRRRLRDLLADGILIRTHHGRRVRYALAPGARRLGLITVLAARWAWEWSAPAAAGDLPGLLRLLAPVAHVPEPLTGVCRVHIDAEGIDPADVYLRAKAGTLVALRVAPNDPPHAVGYAPPKAWCDALLERNPSGIMTRGNTALMVGVLTSVSAALVS
jgi:DNA-binding HxlR family transcriptional regulator